MQKAAVIKVFTAHDDAFCSRLRLSCFTDAQFSNAVDISHINSFINFRLSNCHMRSQESGW